MASDRKALLERVERSGLFTIEDKDRQHGTLIRRADTGGPVTAIPLTTGDRKSRQAVLSVLYRHGLPKVEDRKAARARARRLRTSIPEPRRATVMPASPVAVVAKKQLPSALAEHAARRRDESIKAISRILDEADRPLTAAEFKALGGPGNEPVRTAVEAGLVGTVVQRKLKARGAPVVYARTAQILSKQHPQEMPGYRAPAAKRGAGPATAAAKATKKAPLRAVPATPAESAPVQALSAPQEAVRAVASVPVPEPLSEVTASLLFEATPYRHKGCPVLADEHGALYVVRPLVEAQ